MVIGSLLNKLFNRFILFSGWFLGLFRRNFRIILRVFAHVLCVTIPLETTYIASVTNLVGNKRRHDKPLPQKILGWFYLFFCAKNVVYEVILRRKPYSCIRDVSTFKCKPSTIVEYNLCCVYG